VRSAENKCKREGVTSESVGLEIEKRARPGESRATRHCLYALIEALMSFRTKLETQGNQSKSTHKYRVWIYSNILGVLCAFSLPRFPSVPIRCIDFLGRVKVCESFDGANFSALLSSLIHSFLQVRSQVHFHRVKSSTTFNFNSASSQTKSHLATLTK